MTLIELRKSKVHSMTLAAMLIAVGVITTTLLAFYVPMFGYPSVKIDLVSVVILLGGALLGPLYGAVIGVSIDLLGYSLTSAAWAVYLPGLAINKILIGMIGGFSSQLFFSNKQRHWVKIADVVLPIIVSIGAISYVLATSQVSANGQTIVLTPELKTFLVITIIAITAIILVALVVFKKHPIMSDATIYSVVFITLLVEIFVDVLLSPYWLAPITGVPYLIGAFTRLFRTVIIVPFKVALLTFLLRFTKTRIK